MKKSKTLQMTVDAMLAALCAVLGYIALDLGNIKITFEGIPVLISALLFGPVDGLIVGGLGTFVYQILRYGFTATTFLWILPYVIYGFLMGAYAKKVNYKFNYILTGIVIILGELMITALNTGSLVIDSKIYGYYTPVFIYGSLGIRLIICFGKGIVLSVVLPALMKVVSNIKEVSILRGESN
ncbi:MAG: ECF transporter S component [Eubacteriales bacterium]|nr:ECF transporter S component [Eubacteriales bacterium]